MIRVGSAPRLISSLSPGACPTIAWPTACACARVEAPHLHGAAVALYVRAGSRYEGVANNGFHTLSSTCCFVAAAQYPDSFALNRAIEERCGMLIGETGRDYSLYSGIAAPARPGEHS